MKKLGLLLTAAMLLAVAAAGYGACGGRLESDSDGTESAGPNSQADLSAAPQPPEPDGPADDDPPFGFGAHTLHWAIIGEIDSTNRYAFTVAVAGRFVEWPSGVGPCNGVLVSPRLVLTAARCLCPPSEATASEGGAATITPSTCTASAEVTAHFDLPDVPDKATRSRLVKYAGEVRPHPELRILLDRAGHVISSTADLAVVRLPRPLELPIAPVAVASDVVRPDESMVVVGYPYLEDAERRYSREPVTGFQGPDRTRIQFGSLDLSDYQGDRGGPCLRETEGAPTLVGISAWGFGTAPTCTGIYAYRAWIEREIELVAAAEVIEPEKPAAQDKERPAEDENDVEDP